MAVGNYSSGGDRSERKVNRSTPMAVAKTEASAAVDKLVATTRERGRWAQTTINLGSGGRGTALVGRRRHNARNAVLLGQMGGGECAAVLVGRRRGVSGSEG